MPPRARVRVDMQGLFTQALTDAVSRPTIHNYTPHEKQESFHRSTAKIRQLIGGNRSGKTVGGCVEDVWWMKGEHPYRKVPPAPNVGRIVTVSRREGIDKIIIPQILRWIPPSLLINGSWEDSYHKSDFNLKLTNGSEVELMTYEQDTVKFAGVSRHWTHFDEEPPEDIYNESIVRLIDTKGSHWLTMTPVDGMTWSHDRIYYPGTVGMNPRIFVVEVDIEENPHISQDEIDEVLGGLDAEERQARKEGKYVQFGGLVYKHFNIQVHVIPEIDPAKVFHWTQYKSMDYGLNNPTCWLWHAVSPSNLAVTWDELYENEMIVEEFAEEIKRRDMLPGRRPSDLSVGDPSTVQRNGITKTSIQQAYAIEGVPYVLGNNSIETGVEKINFRLKTGHWVITENCKMLIREMSRLRWKVYENSKKRRQNNPRREIHKLNDHAPDSARYFHSVLPDLRIRTLDRVVNRAYINRVVNEAIGGAKTYYVGNNFDHHLSNPPPAQGNDWTVVDEHMGGYY